jgi:PTH1 family peptidyl-tRNA hydrolase
VAADGQRPRPDSGGRKGTPTDLLVVGLGNPGSKYDGTRHNVGAEVVRLLAERHGARLRRSKYLAESDEITIDGCRLALAVPSTYMNESGQAVGALVRRFDVDMDRLLVVHDELDLEPGRIRVKEGGGLAGHNGLRSITGHLKSQEYLRLRIGVGKPPTSARGADHVLRRPPKAVRVELDVAVQRAADAVEVVLAEGVAEAMNRYNRSA